MHNLVRIMRHILPDPFCLCGAPRALVCFVYFYPKTISGPDVGCLTTDKRTGGQRTDSRRRLAVLYLGISLAYNFYLLLIQLQNCSLIAHIS